MAVEWQQNWLWNGSRNGCEMAAEMVLEWQQNASRNGNRMAAKWQQNGSRTPVEMVVEWQSECQYNGSRMNKPTGRMGMHAYMGTGELSYLTIPLTGINSGVATTPSATMGQP